MASHGENSRDQVAIPRHQCGSVASQIGLFRQGVQDYDSGWVTVANVAIKQGWDTLGSKRSLPRQGGVALIRDHYRALLSRPLDACMRLLASEDVPSGVRRRVHPDEGCVRPRVDALWIHADASRTDEAGADVICRVGNFRHKDGVIASQPQFERQPCDRFLRPDRRNDGRRLCSCLPWRLERNHTSLRCPQSHCLLEFQRAFNPRISSSISGIGEGVLDDRGCGVDRCADRKVTHSTGMLRGACARRFQTVPGKVRQIQGTEQSIHTSLQQISGEWSLARDHSPI